jgi:poly-gamma-glutamate synthase PgsB/CapB
MSDLSGDLFSKGALGSFVATIFFLSFLGVWFWWSKSLERRIERIPLRIMVTGTRGKSSTVRIIHSMLREAGYAVYGKTTGTAAAEFSTDGKETKTWRFGNVSVLEVLESIHRATKRKNISPTALVIECMAVSPELIGLVTECMLKPNITIITNGLYDHLEEEGLTKRHIAMSLSHGIPGSEMVISSEKNPEVVNIFKQITEQNNSIFVLARPELEDSNFLKQVSITYPDNAIIALKLGEYLNLDEETIKTGILKASREPGENLIYRKNISNLEITYVDIGAVNDADSFHTAVRPYRYFQNPDTVTIALLNGRWDRPLRSLQFAGLLSKEIFDGVMISGEPSFHVKKILLEDGWLEQELARLNLFAVFAKYWLWQLKKLTSTINPNVSSVLVISVENIHDPIADSVRNFFSQGELVEGVTN